jgi:zinc transporter ZupT
MVAIAAFFLGVLIMAALEFIMSRLAPKVACPCHSPKRCKCEGSCNCALVAAQKMKATSWLAFIAMTLHHVPEGLVFFVSITTDLKTGVLIGLILLIHVFPEGIAIGAPTIAAFPDQPWRSLVYGAIAGFAQPVGTHN